MSIRVGIIAEEENDFDVVSELLRKIVKRDSLVFRKAIAHGSGKLHGKCSQFAKSLLNGGCKALVVLRDSDGNNCDALRLELEPQVSGIGFTKKVIVIPVYMIEAWLLSDMEAVRRGLNLKRTPRDVGNPEAIADPKLRLSQIARAASKNEVEYFHTVHNKLIAKHVSLQRVRACSSFLDLYAFGKSI